jgi:hypothetical protein
VDSTSLSATGGRTFNRLRPTRSYTTLWDVTRCQAECVITAQMTSGTLLVERQARKREAPSCVHPYLHHSTSQYTPPRTPESPAVGTPTRDHGSARKAEGRPGGVRSACPCEGRRSVVGRGRLRGQRCPCSARRPASFLARLLTRFSPAPTGGWRPVGPLRRPAQRSRVRLASQRSDFRSLWPLCARDRRNRAVSARHFSTLPHTRVSRAGTCD